MKTETKTLTDIKSRMVDIYGPDETEKCTFWPARKITTLARQEEKNGYAICKRNWAGTRLLCYAVAVEKSDKSPYAATRETVYGRATCCWIEISPRGVCESGPGLSGRGFRTVAEAREYLLKERSGR